MRQPRKPTGQSLIVHRTCWLTERKAERHCIHHATAAPWLARGTNASSGGSVGPVIAVGMQYRFTIVRGVGGPEATSVLPDLRVLSMVQEGHAQERTHGDRPPNRIGEDVLRHAAR